MTHGCLKIKVFAEPSQRSVILHTCHTAMDTPEWVKEAPAFFAEHRADFLVDIAIERRYKRPEILQNLKNIHRGQFEYAPSVASMIIACRPDCYEPITPGFEQDLPSWSGFDNPDLLTIFPDHWILQTHWMPPAQMKRVYIDPYKIALDWVWGEVKKRRKQA